jgi:hypothetical protein
MSDAEDLLRRLVKETPFTPTETGLDLHVSFALIKEMQAAIKPTEDAKLRGNPEAHGKLRAKPVTK